MVTHYAAAAAENNLYSRSCLLNCFFFSTSLSLSSVSHSPTQLLGVEPTTKYRMMLQVKLSSLVSHERTETHTHIHIFAFFFLQRTCIIWVCFNKVWDLCVQSKFLLQSDLNSGITLGKKKKLSTGEENSCKKGKHAESLSALLL